MISYQRFIVTIRAYLVLFPIYTAISVENRRIFPRPLLFCVPDEGVPLEIGYDAGDQKLE